MKKYSVELSRQAARILRRMEVREQAIYRRVAHAIDDLETDPFQGKALQGILKDRYSYRVGSYRIIYSIWHRHLIVYIIDVGHRRDVYR